MSIWGAYKWFKMRNTNRKGTKTSFFKKSLNFLIILIYQNKVDSNEKFYKDGDKNNTLKSNFLSPPSKSSMNAPSFQGNSTKLSGLNSNLTKTTNRDLFLKSDMWYE